MADKQKTIAKSITVSGVGLHTGKSVNLTFHPAPEGHGIKFRRTDLEGQPVIDANIDHVLSTDRGTSLNMNGAIVHTTEHVLAALAGMEVDNVLIDLDQEETPIKDGSSRYFIEALQEAGIEEQTAIREYIELKEAVTFSDPINKVELTAIPHDSFKVSTMINFETKVLGTQNAVMENIRDFKDGFANCRTFVFLHELEYLLQNQLIRGGDLSNAIVFVNKAVSQEELDRLAKLFDKPSVKVKQEGILNNLDLHFENEPARHKLLDIVGDLTLLGKPLKAHIIANRPGHAANAGLAKLIKKQLHKDKKMNNAPEFDPTKPPLMDIHDIMRLLPHRPPFLLIDKVLEMNENTIVGLKNVTMNEPFFVGHFPGDPVMPGVLQIEALAQTGGVLVLSQVPDPENYTTLFLKIDNVKFRQKVLPGDTLILEAILPSPVRRGICQMTGKGYVGGKVVLEANLTASILKKSALKPSKNSE